MVCLSDNMNRTEGVWCVLDSECSAHMFNNVNLLSNVSELQIPINISIAKKGETLIGTRGGFIQAKSLVNGEGNILM